MNPLRAAVAVLIALRLGAELLLGALNRAEIRRRRPDPPPSAAAVMDAATYGRAADYALARSRFEAVADAAGAVILAVAAFSGFLPWLWRLERAWGASGRPAGVGALYFATVALVLSVLALPLDAWARFGLEARFGFNRSTVALWVGDKLKQGAVLFALLVVLGYAVLEAAADAGPGWWLWSFAVFFGFQLLLAAGYSRWIQPLFNRLEPLPAGTLRDRLTALAGRARFSMRDIQVMDGSRRSAHSNAFFAGFGRMRRIVLFDTLIAQLQEDELEAVVAHEIGHYRLGHVPRMLLLSGAFSLAGFALIGWLARSPWFNPAFGFRPGELAPAFLLFGLLGGLATFWVSPALNALSRRHEYQADAFARDAVGGPAPLVSALRRLARENLANLAPHPWFSAFHYSHPTLAEREGALAEPMD